MLKSQSTQRHSYDFTDIKMTVAGAQVSEETPAVLKQLVYMARDAEDLEGMTDDKRAPHFWAVMRRLDSGQLHREPNNLISKICLDIFSLKFFQRQGDQEATGEGKQSRD